ncbi:MAG: hypothetical protein IPJ26_18555 [Bacteroidetes bacterium]|nr:hypothetical protein [Bacteroidota bacterium]
MKKINILLAVCVFIATSASAQWSIDSLSSAYSGLAVTQNGSKVIFASSTKFELYDFATNTWSTKNMLPAETQRNSSYHQWSELFWWRRFHKCFFL